MCDNFLHMFSNIHTILIEIAVQEMVGQFAKYGEW